MVMKRRRCGTTNCFLLALVCLQSFVKAGENGVAGQTDGSIVVPMPLPDLHGVKHNDYKCTGVGIPSQDQFITQFEPKADPHVAHHMLIFGCSSMAPHGSWNCKSNGMICEGQPHILFAWALNASGLHLPSNVGVQIGPSVGINSIIVQIHYGYPEKYPDLVTSNREALVLHTTQQSQPYVAGIYLIGSAASIQSGDTHSFVDSACRFPGPKSIYPFAFRTHAHHLGEQIAGYVVKNGWWELIGTRSPQDAQAFYPAANRVIVNKGDLLAMRCVFNMEGKSHSVHMGANSEDEMCNFYIMYYTANDGRSLYSNECWQNAPRSLLYPHLPSLTEPTTPPTATPTTAPVITTEQKTSDEEDNYECPKPVPPGSSDSRCVNATTTTSIPVIPATSPIPKIEPNSPESVEQTSSTTLVPSNPFSEGGNSLKSNPLGLVPAKDWALNGIEIPGVTLGQVSAVAVDKEGAVHILHRGPVVWDYGSFNFDFTYRHKEAGPIKVPTLLKFSSLGTPQRAWAESMFYLPHGLTIDPEGNFWVTDVALHQVFKFTKFGSSEPAMILGTEFKPGSGFGHFCQPASVAVDNSGNFYIADGYCNRRILKFSITGQLLETWQDPIANVPLFIPHKLTLNAAQDKLYLADRGNSRVVVYGMKSGHGEVFSDKDTLGGKPFAIFTNGSSDWPMHGVFGGKKGVTGFSLDRGGKVISTWGPKGGFEQPHDLTVDPVNKAVYVTEIGPNRIWKFVSVDLSPQVDVTDLLDSQLSKTDSSQPAPHSSHESTNSANPTNFHQGQIPVNFAPSSSSPTMSSYDSTFAHGILPDTPLKGPKPIDGEAGEHHNEEQFEADGTTEGDKNTSVSIESSVNGKNKPHGVPPKKVGNVNLGVIIAVFVLATVFGLILIGVLKEHKYLRFRGAVCLRRGKVTIDSVNGKAGSVTKKKRSNPKKTLHSLLGPSKLGFSRLRTYDSDSEEEEFPVFNRV